MKKKKRIREELNREKMEEKQRELNDKKEITAARSTASRFNREIIAKLPESGRERRLRDLYWEEYLDENSYWYLWSMIKNLPYTLSRDRNPSDFILPETRIRVAKLEDPESSAAASSSAPAIPARVFPRSTPKIDSARQSPKLMDSDDNSKESPSPTLRDSDEESQQN